jgi:signal transduction histidine kinase
LSVALRQARLLEATQNQLKELSVLHELANTGQQVSSVEEWIDSATDIISQSIYTGSFTIGLLNKNDTHIQFQRSRDDRFSSFNEIAIKDTRFSDVISTGELRFTPSEVFVPIKVGRKVIGVMTASNGGVGAFDEKDERLLTTIAGQLAVVIQRLQSFEAEQYARRTAETMRAANMALTKTLDLDVVLDTVLSYISQLIPYDSANVMLYEDDKYLVVRASRGYARWDSESELSLPAYEVENFPVFSKIKNSLKSLIVADVSQYSDWIQTKESVHINCWIGIPLVSGGEFIGLLALNHKEPDFYTAEHQQLAELFAVQATIAIQNAGLFEQTIQRAKELEEITRISSALRLSNKQEEMFSVLLNEATDLFKANTGAVFLVDQNDIKASAVNGPGESEINILSHKDTRELLWDVVQTGEPLFVSEQPIDSRYDKTINSISLLPLKTSEGVIGIVLFAWENQETLSDSNRRLLKAFVEITGNALDRARTLETLEQQVSSRTRDLSILYQVTAVASAHSDLESISNKSLEKILEVVDGNSGTIHLLNQEKNCFSLISHLGISNTLLNHLKTLPVDDPFFGKIADTNAPLIIMDFKEDERIPKSLLSLECQSFIGLPIRTSGQTRGILSIYLESSQQYTSDNVRLLMMVIDQMGIALERALLQEQAEEAIIIEERQRLARELHDAVTQSLYSLALMADAARKFSDKAMWARSEHFLRLVQNTAKDVLKEMRLLVYELRPTALEREGFVSALRQRLETVEARAGIKTDFRIEQAFTPPIDIQVALYRISQEALNNALKHAQATSVSIEYRATQDQIALSITDNGRGFNLEQVGGGIGLKSMRERVEKFGGEFKVTTGIEKGTTVSVLFEGDR